MRVVHVIVSEPAGTIGGADMHVLELAAAQQAAGVVEPTVLAPRASAEFSRRARALGVRAVGPRRLGLHGLRTLAAKTDVLHGHGYDADVWSAGMRAVPAWRSSAAVFTAHGFVETAPGVRALTWLDLAVLRTVGDAVIACSANLAVRVSAAGVKAPIVTIFNGVCAPSAPTADAVQAIRDAAGARAGTPIVAFVGRLADEKRPDTFVRAAAIVAAGEPQCRFVVGGEGPARSLVEELVIAEGLGDRLTVLGFCRDVGAVLAGVDVLVNTSDSESTPRMLAEAMRAGVPVVATTVGGVPDIVDAGVSGLLAPPDTPQATAHHILRLLRDPALRASIARAGRERAERDLAIERMETQVRDVYSVAIAARVSRARRGAARSTPGARAR